MKTIQKKTKSYYVIFLCFIISIIICSSGYQILDLTNKDSKKKTKTVAEIIEIRYINDGNYELKVIYFIKRTKYTSNLITKEKKKVGDVINIFYNDDDPTVITDKSNQSMFFTGNIVITCGCCVFIFVLISLFSKPEKQEKSEIKYNNTSQNLLNPMQNPMQINTKIPYFVQYIPMIK
jgi:hypothetical protein